MLILFSTESAVSGMWGFTILIFFVRCHWIKITNIPVEVCFFQFGNSCGNTSFLPSIDKPLTVNNYFENSYFCSFCMPIFSPYFIWSHLILKIPHLKQQDFFVKIYISLSRKKSNLLLWHFLSDIGCTDYLLILLTISKWN